MSAMLEMLVQGLSWILNPIVTFVRAWIVEPCLRDPAFQSGFIRAFFVAGVFGFLVRELMYRLGQVQALLAPTREPVTQNGPSQYRRAVDTTRAYGRAVAMLALVILVIACVVIVGVQAFSSTIR